MRRRGQRDDGRPRPAPAGTTATLVAAGLTVALAASGAGAQERLPRIPSGITLVVAPAQSVVPTASGAWPGGAASRAAALETMNSELDFAISEEERARSWTPPAEVVEQVGRNPMLDVDPEQLAYRGLLAKKGEDDPELHAPLHGQLRKLTALLDARLVALPLRVWYAPADTAADTTAGAGDGPSDGDGAASAARREPPGRAMVRIALVDTRAGRLLWTGDIGGAPASARSPEALATLAANVVRTLVSP